jgi:hypothetical protein
LERFSPKSRSFFDQIPDQITPFSTTNLPYQTSNFQVTQINGITIFIDGRNMSLKYANLFTLSNFKSMSKVATNSPHRLKRCYFYNFPAFAKVLGEIAIR